MAEKSDVVEQKITVTKNGPYLISGAVPLQRETIIADAENVPERWNRTAVLEHTAQYALCRCGQSGNQPFCDGTHLRCGFDGTETADNGGFVDIAKLYSGPTLELLDNVELCASASFCQRAGGTWAQVAQSDDPARRALAIEIAGNCPAGRLVVRDKSSGEIIEQKFAPAISVTDDPPHEVSGPLWVKGGVAIQSVAGVQYEVRNRVTLCRCGQSRNKPFCDGSHCEAKFRE